MIIAYDGKEPKIDPTAYVTANATVIGDVEIGADCSVWFGAVIRGDSNSIRIGSRTNIQDLCIFHVNAEHRLTVGNEVTVGHRATLHGCTIRDRVLVGMSATVMNGAEIGSDSIIGAGSLVTENTKVPPRSLILGVPAKVKRELTEAEVARVHGSCREYLETASVYKKTAATLKP